MNIGSPNTWRYLQLSRARRGYSVYGSIDPDYAPVVSGLTQSYHNYLSYSMNVIRNSGRQTTMLESEMNVYLASARTADMTGSAGQPDGKCDMRDIGLAARNFGTTVPPAPARAAYCDLTGPTAGLPDGIVDMRDIELIAEHYGECYLGDFFCTSL